MKMENKEKIGELLFGIGIYPNMQAIDKFCMCIELMEELFPTFDIHSVKGFKPLKKLSIEKKASFVSFYNQTNIKQEMQRYKDAKIQWVDVFSTEYPKHLKTIYAPPVILFYKGKLELLEQYIWLGVVGSREFTPYGQLAVQHILETLFEQSKNQIGVISGLAKGIDTEAHVLTIKNHQKTVGVIGTGLDVYYPKTNQQIQDLMSKNQLVLSEYPMGAKPLKFHFPERNRIIAGLSRGVLVVESRKRSGSLITAYNALDEGRDVFAVPGSIFEETQMGNHRLIQLGALLTQNGEDILQEWLLI